MSAASGESFSGTAPLPLKTPNISRALTGEPLDNETSEAWDASSNRWGHGHSGGAAMQCPPCFK